MVGGEFAYGVVQDSDHFWIFKFRTRKPARGSAMFQPQDLFKVLIIHEPPIHFVDCGKMASDLLAEIPKPSFYKLLEEKYQPKDPSASRYVRVPYHSPEGWGSEKRITEAEAIAEGLHKYEALTSLNYEARLAVLCPNMEVREVPEEFLDRVAIRKMEAGEPVLEKPLPKQEVELVVIIPVQGDDPALDEPEEQFEEPLSEALEEAECGSCTSSGTTPDSFDIDVDTVKPSLRRCLSVIRRVLKKAGAPAPTIIRQLPDNPDDPPIDHPLDAAPKKAASN
jgi:hypothetical protein